MTFERSRSCSAPERQCSGMIDVDQGYSIHDQVFDASQMRDVLDALAAAHVERTKAGARHVLRVPRVRELSSDSRLVAIAGRLLGTTPVAFRATLFDKSPTSNWLVVWHQDRSLPLVRRIDGPGWGPWSTKAGTLCAPAPAWALERVVALRVSLDESTETNGPLRVLPNTHRDGVLSDGQIAALVQRARPVDCVVPAGGVVAMRPLTVHASSKSRDVRPRRVLHIEYATAVDLGAAIPLAVG